MEISFGRLLRMAIQMFMAFPAGGAIFSALAAISSLHLFVLALVTTYALTFWLGIVIHELGHAAAAMISRQKVRTIAAWPVEYHVRSRKFSPCRWAVTSDIGGFVSLEADQWPTYRQHITFIGGGIAANLLASVVLLAIINMFGLTEAAHNGIGLILTALALTSLGIALGNAVPVRMSDDHLSRTRSAPINSDGAQLLDAIRARRNSQWKRWT